MELKLTLPVPVSINKLYINEYRFNPVTRRREPTGARILSKEGEHVRSIMRELSKEAVENSDWDIEEIGDRFLYMDVDIYFNRRGRDADNIFKSLQDSMQGVVYKNDSQLLPRTQRVLFDKNDSRVEITFTPVEYVGIFDNEEEYIKFEEKCQSCTRFLNGRCSILNNSREGTVREEVDLDSYECSEYKKKST